MTELVFLMLWITFRDTCKVTETSRLAGGRWCANSRQTCVFPRSAGSKLDVWLWKGPWQADCTQLPENDIISTDKFRNDVVKNAFLCLNYTSIIMYHAIR